MDLNTASAVISFYDRLEQGIISFYEDLASTEDNPEGRETFLTLAKESRRHRDMVLRTYREVITDAFEAGFSFPNLRESDYEITMEIKDDLSFQDKLNIAIGVEENSYKFCIDVSKSAGALLADITQSFEWAANRKAKRKQKLKSLLEKHK